MATWNDLITLAYEDIAAIAPGDTLSSVMQTDGQTRLNQLLSSLSTEGLMAFNQVSQSFNLQFGITAYTLGVGGSFSTSARPQRAIAWRAAYGGVLSSGGRVLSLQEFGAAANQAQSKGETTPIPEIVGADTAFPLINVRVLPPPNFSPGTIEIDYWTPITQIADFTQPVVGLPDGWQEMLHWNLAAKLLALYPREGVDPQFVLGQAQNTKGSIVQQNNMLPPAPAQAQ